MKINYLLFCLIACAMSSCCIFMITDEYITNAPLLGSVPVNGQVTPASKLIKGPADMRGSILNYQNDDGGGKILVEEIDMFQDSDDNVYVGKLIGTDLATKQNIDFNGENMVKQNKWIPLNSFDDFVWRVGDDLKVNIDKLRLENIEVNGESETLISILEGENIKYEKPGPPVLCLFKFSLYCGNVPPCNFIDSLSISCTGTPPLCYCESLFPNCPTKVSFWCQTVDCDQRCQLLGRWNEEVGCLCDI